jgi:AAA15 family ATPase/GTPase
MFLRSIEIQNYRSLEQVRLDNLQQFNVLIGRNNAGKSSVFEAISWLATIYLGRGSGRGVPCLDITRQPPFLCS